MGQWTTVVSFFLALGVGVVQMLPAAEAKLKNLKVVPYSKLTCPKKILGQETGVLQILEPAKGKMLVHVTFDLEVAWDKETESLSFDETSLRVEAGGAAGEYRGELLPTGEMILQGIPHFSAFRPFSDDEQYEPSTTAGNGFWEIGQDAKEIALHLGDTSAKAEVTGEPRPYEPPQDFAVQVVSASLHDSYQQSIGYDNKFPVELVNDGGSILELKMKLTPQIKGEEKLQELWSNLRSDRFYLSFGKGGRALALGHLDFEKRFADSNGLSLYPDKPAQPQMVTIFFAVPSNLKSFDVRYSGRLVVKGTVDQ